MDLLKQKYTKYVLLVVNVLISIFPILVKEVDADIKYVALIFNVLSELFSILLFILLFKLWMKFFDIGNKINENVTSNIIFFYFGLVTLISILEISHILQYFLVFIINTVLITVIFNYLYSCGVTLKRSLLFSGSMYLILGINLLFGIMVKR